MNNFKTAVVNESSVFEPHYGTVVLLSTACVPFTASNPYFYLWTCLSLSFG